MLIVNGTVPDEGFPLTEGKVTLKNDIIYVNGHSTEVNRGTPALLASIIKTCEVLNLEAPTTFLAGDTGLGQGSRALYQRLTERLPKMDCHTLCFHYLQPDVDWHYRVMSAIESMKRRPILIADAGYMYAAKMADSANIYDLFTPDAGELAFLADEEAPHPFYTRGFILHESNHIPELIQRAYDHRNAAKTLLIKGATDYVVHNGNILKKIDSPSTEALEPIGGTGDTVTGIVTALIYSGISPEEASVIAAKTNRLAGAKANPTPASQVLEIINKIPEALREILSS